MKKIMIPLLVALLAFNFTSSAQESTKKNTIHWMTLEQAVAAQKKMPKKIIIDAYTVWCGPCKMLEKNTFSNPDVITYINANFYAVKFNAEGNEKIIFKENTFKNPNYEPSKSNGRNSSHQLAGYFGVKAYPTIIYLDENQELIAPIAGYQTPKSLEVFLKLFGTDAFRKINSQEAYEAFINNFKYEFTE